MSYLHSLHRPDYSSHDAFPCSLCEINIIVDVYLRYQRIKTHHYLNIQLSNPESIRRAASHEVPALQAQQRIYFVMAIRTVVHGKKSS
jgi:hypothetical protein